LWAIAACAAGGAGEEGRLKAGPDPVVSFSKSSLARFPRHLFRLARLAVDSFGRMP
jgi:hypothetical protein